MPEKRKFIAAVIGILALLAAGELFAMMARPGTAPMPRRPVETSTEAPNPADQLTALKQCAPSSGADCSMDVFQKVWRRIEADNGEIIKIDMRSINHSGDRPVDVFVYIDVSDKGFDPMRLRRLLFDCAGHYQDISDMGFSPMQDAPSRSVAGRIQEIVCAGAQ